jgi:hypothetical protein
MTWEQELARNRRETAKLKRVTRESLNRTLASAGQPQKPPYMARARRLTKAEVAELQRQGVIRLDARPQAYRPRAPVGTS